MRVLHTSDLHGSWDKLIETLEGGGFDLWVDSGDFFPNFNRGNPEEEVPFQRAYLQEQGPRLVAALGTNPMISVSGNHDFVSLAAFLQEQGAEAHDLTHGSVECLGVRFAGFREIPYIAGEWCGEVLDFSALIDQAFAADPDVLVTHAPPSGILDYDVSAPRGIPALQVALAYRPHLIRAHLFGHVHGSGGTIVEEMGIRFSNAATRQNFLEV